MPDGVADAQALLPLAIQQDGEQVVSDHILDDGGDVGQNAVEIERLRSRGRNVEQEIEQLGAFLETHLGFWGGGGHVRSPTL